MPMPSKGILLVLLIVYLCLLATSDLDEQKTVLVNRRLMFDTYLCINETELSSCQTGGNATYLVSEKRCVKDQELFGECSFGFTSSEGQPNFTTAISFSDTDGMELTNAILYDSNIDNLTNATIRTLNTSQYVANGSFCSITSLEVYRGADDITEIRSDGLSLGNAGTLNIERAELAYSSNDYEGELYRMNLSCYDEGFPPSGCLFFKLIGRTNLTSDKFGSLINGIFDNSTETEDYPGGESTQTFTTPTMQMRTIKNTNNITITTSVTETPSDSSLVVNIFEIGSPSFYIVVGVAGGILLLVVIVVILCVIVACLAKNKDEPQSPPTAGTAQVRLHTLVQLQVEVPDPLSHQGSMNNFLNYDDETSTNIDEKEDPFHNIQSETTSTTTTDQAQEVVDSGKPVSRKSTKNHPKSHTTAAASEGDTSPKKVDLGRSISQENILTSVTFETFKPRYSSKRRKRPSSWAVPGQEESSLSGEEEEEEEQIYDTVAPFTMVLAGTTTANYATVNASVSLPARESVYDVPRKAAPIYNVPRVGRRRFSKKWERVRNRCKSEEMLFTSESHYDVPKKINMKRK